jgi:hypothetical protein
LARTPCRNLHKVRRRLSVFYSRNPRTSPEDQTTRLACRIARTICQYAAAVSQSGATTWKTNDRRLALLTPYEFRRSNELNRLSRLAFKRRKPGQLLAYPWSRSYARIARRVCGPKTPSTEP